MSDFNKDDYLRDMPNVPSEDTATNTGCCGADNACACEQANESAHSESASGEQQADSEHANGQQEQCCADGSCKASESAENADNAENDELTPLGKAKKEAADYLEALQRERAEFVNFRNRAVKDQELFRKHGITDVLTSLLPALDDIDRIRQHGGLDDSFAAVAAKIDKAFDKFGVVKFGEKGEVFDPTKHEAILHKPDPEATEEVVDTVVEAGYKVGDRVIRAARVVVASPQSE